MRLRFALPLIALLFIQTLSLVHGAEHLFHHHDEACDIYIDADRLTKSSLGLTEFIWPVEFAVANTVFQFSIQSAVPQTLTSYDSRAPPQAPISA